MTVAQVSRYEARMCGADPTEIISRAETRGLRTVDAACSAETVALCEEITVVQCDGDTLRIVTPGAGGASAAREVAWALTGQSAPEPDRYGDSSPVRFPDKLSVPVGCHELPESLADILGLFTPGPLADYRCRDVQPVGGPAIAPSRFIMPAPDGLRTVTDTGDPANDHPLLLWPDDDGWHLDFTVDVFDRCDMDTLVAALGAGDPADVVERTPGGTVNTLIVGALESGGGRPAVRCGNEELSCGELNLEVGRLAGQLEHAGVKRGSVVGVHLPRSIQSVAVILAVLRRGAAYCPLDPSLPTARLRTYAQKAGIDAVVTEDPHRWDLPCVVPDNAWEDFSPGQVEVCGGDLFAVLFTSGSTGSPKAVGQTVSSMTRLAEWHVSRSLRHRGGVVAQYTTLNFDVSIQEMIAALVTGSVLDIVPDTLRADGEGLVAWLRERHITEFFCPQVMLQEICRVATASDRPLTGLRHMYQAGEPLVMNTWIRDFLVAHPATTLHNHYGPTETHVVCEFSLCCGDYGDGPVPLGRPTTPGAVLVLGPDLSVLPPGNTGELYVRAPHTARGYTGQPSATATTFLPDPVRPGERIYRTGDIVELDEKGCLHFVGRVDDQVKIRGHRVEPGEITACALAVPGVGNAAVLVVETPAHEKQLQLVVSGNPENLQDAVCRRLSTDLPDYMIPATVTVVDDIPRTSTGKVDRRALLENAGDGTDRRPEQRETDAISLAWESVLGVHPGQDDDFFALGGSSLSAVFLSRELSTALCTPVGVRDIHDHPVFSDLSALLRLRREEKGGTQTLFGALTRDPGGRYEPFPLLDQQQAYIIGRDPEFDGGNVACHLYLEYTGASGSLDHRRLEDSLNRVVGSHPALRTVFDTADMTQRVLRDPGRVTIPITRGREADGREVRRKLSHSQHDFARFPLFEVEACDDGDTYTLCVSIDALIADAHSVRRIMTDWEKAYRGEPLTAGEGQGATFRDYVRNYLEWREGAGAEAVAAAARYWNRRLASLPAAPALPLAATGPGDPHFENLRYTVDTDAWGSVKDAAALHGVTPNAALLAIYSAALAEYSDSGHFMINVPTMGRDCTDTAVQDIVGEFASFILLDVDVRDVSCIAELAVRIQKRLSADLANTAVSGVEVLRKLQHHRGSFSAPVAPVVFTSELGVADDMGSLFDGALTQSFAVSQTPQVWFDLLVSEENGSLLLRADVLQGQFEEGVSDNVFAGVVRGVRSLTERAAWLAPLYRTVGTAAALARGYGGRPGAVEDLVEPIFTHPGDGVAVIAPDRRVSRNELAGRSARISDLVGGHAADDGPVAVAVGDAADTVAAIYGVLASGRPYLPVDPDCPVSRAAKMFTAAGISALITDRRDLMDLCPAPVIDASGTSASRSAVPTVVESGNRCGAVLFTSGSTGTPKAVPVPVSGMRLCVSETLRLIGIGPEDRSLALSRNHHDLSFFDLFVVQAAGGSVVVPPRRPDPEEWARLAVEHRVTCICAVPAAVDMLLDGAAATGADLSGLRIVMTGGDRVLEQLVERLREAAPEVRVFSIGGPCETTGWNIVYEVPAEGPPPGWDGVPYGRPLPGTYYRIVDSSGRDRPDGAVGEMVVAGPGVMEDYLGDCPGARFTTDPRTGMRWYHTGDLGSWKDGLIRFVGRADRQLEIRGNRVEPAEIEAVCKDVDGVLDAVVVPLRSGAEVVGTVVFITGDADVTDVGNELQQALLPAVRPRGVHKLDCFPVNRAGKIDHAQLEKAAADTFVREDGDTDPLTELICDIWAEQLQIDSAPPHLSFFDLGGDSLTGFRLIATLREFFGDGVPVSVRDVMGGLSPRHLVDLMRASPEKREYEHLADLYRSTV
ncbi:non-ribosomal peptide synthetase [Corynebacterium pygosceleis]|uniref:non-ribosomal peptide synthetase n=1 Tax=Corynebacterium pygosceleis TaxID=2800406 RepID=UPI0019035C75|nr:non-ribosomal peptide synthetase [Corynebacterium pygosceleis]MCL0119734.1 non-ribosomal peptide synthetase [Corynebacterium pygosceleis]